MINHKPLKPFDRGVVLKVWQIQKNNLDVVPDVPSTEEYCAFRKSGRCGGCVVRCPSGALTKEGYDREKCYQVLRTNAGLYTEFGSSYTNEAGDQPNREGSEVCGKCVANVPCSFF